LRNVEGVNLDSESPEIFKPISSEIVSNPFCVPARARTYTRLRFEDLDFFTPTGYRDCCGKAGDAGSRDSVGRAGRISSDDINPFSEISGECGSLGYWKFAKEESLDLETQTPVYIRPPSF
jgi:hypothetical protein